MKFCSSPGFTIKNPSGLFISEASFAKYLEGAQPTETVRPICSLMIFFILNAISPTISLAKKVDAIVEATTKGYIRYNNVSKEKETSIKKALLKRYIFEFKTEAEAYNVACEIIKKQYNIQGDCVYNMIPRAYKMIEEALIGKLSEH